MPKVSEEKNQKNKNKILALLCVFCITVLYSILYLFLWQQLKGNASYCSGRCGGVDSSRSTVEVHPSWSSEPGWCSSVWASDPEASWDLRVQKPSEDSREGMNEHLHKLER